MDWQTVETAPKDGTVFEAKVGTIRKKCKWGKEWGTDFEGFVCQYNDWHAGLWLKYIISGWRPLT